MPSLRSRCNLRSSMRPRSKQLSDGSGNKTCTCMYFPVWASKTSRQLYLRSIIYAGPSEVRSWAISAGGCGNYALQEVPQLSIIASSGWGLLSETTRSPVGGGELGLRAQCGNKAYAEIPSRSVSSENIGMWGRAAAAAVFSFETELSLEAQQLSCQCEMKCGYAWRLKKRSP